MHARLNIAAHVAYRVTPVAVTIKEEAENREIVVHHMAPMHQQRGILQPSAVGEVAPAIVVDEGYDVVVPILPVPKRLLPHLLQGTRRSDVGCQDCLTKDARKAERALCNASNSKANAAAGVNVQAGRGKGRDIQCSLPAAAHPAAAC